MSNSKPTLFTIATYWDSVPSGYLDGLHNEVSILNAMDVDISFPQCFACGRSHHNAKKIEGKTIENLWTSSKLQKHHINPISLGGEDTIDNIFLLCKDCHKDVPHVQMNAKEMMNWCAHRESHINQKINDIQKSLEQMLASQFRNEDERNDFVQWFMKHGQYEFREYGRNAIRNKVATTNFNHLSVDTIVYLLLKKYKDQFVIG